MVDGYWSKHKKENVVPEVKDGYFIPVMRMGGVIKISWSIRLSTGPKKIN